LFARAARPTGGLAAEAAAWGFTPEAVAALSAAPDPDIVECFPWFETAVRWFCAVAGQWRADMGGRVALDYAAAEAAARMMGIDVTPDSFATLRRLERLAIAEMARAR
jgi:hypothetical protein